MLLPHLVRRQSRRSAEISSDTRYTGLKHAGRLLIELEQAIAAGEQIRTQTVESAVNAYLMAKQDELEAASFRKYRHRGECLIEFCQAEQISAVDELP